jgi:hypothetical protein
MCRYATATAVSFKEFLFVYAGTFKVINDIFGRTINERRIIYFSILNFALCRARNGCEKKKKNKIKGKERN